MIFKKKKNVFLLATLFIVGAFILPLISSAQTIVPQIEGLTTVDIRVAAGSIIQLFLGLLGLIALVIVLYAGFVWMTSGGNEEKISQAKKILSAGVIGLMIILSAYAITTFILNEIQGALTGGNTTPQTCSANVCYGCTRCDADGNYIPDNSCYGCGNNSGGGFDFEVTWNSPTGNDVSLCSIVQVKLNAQVDPSSVDADSFKFYECLSYVNGTCTSVGNNLVTNPASQFSLSSSGKIIKFILGEDYKEDTYYVVDLPIGGIQQDGQNEFLSNEFTWTFKTGDETDIEPPTVINVFPDSEDVCLNSYIEIEFSEDMDLDSLEQTEAFRLYDNLLNDLSNIEFSHNAWDRKLIVYPDRNYIAEHDYYPLLERDIIKDTCGNPLDGNFDTIVQEDNTDDYPTNGPSTTWTFKTGQNEYCEPQITDISPGETYYDSNTSLIITGYYLSGGTTLVFDDDVVVNETSELCLDSSSYWPESSCADGTWRSDEIKVFIPADGGDSLGAVAGNVDVKVQTDQGSTSDSFNLLSPRIDNLSPDIGGKGQYITISGKNFGDEGDIDFTQAEIFFRSNSGEYISAELPCGNEGWQDKQIIISVPDTLVLGNNPYRVQVKKVLNNNEEYWSNLIDFTVTDDDPGPGLCFIDVEEIEYNDQFTLSGFQLGDGNEDRKVVLGDDYDSTPSQVISWDDPVNGQDTTALAVAPNLSSANNVGIRVAVEIDGEWKFSNYLNVDVTSSSANQFQISYISPSVASIGEYVTIYGSGFGNSQTNNKTVKFFSNTGGGDGFGLEGDFDFPSACSSVYWQDDQIIVKVPEGFTTTPFASKIKVIDDQVETNEVTFEVDNESPAPSICSVNPEIGMSGEELEIAGEYFNDVDVITFAYGTAGSDDVNVNPINDNLIRVNVPETETGLIAAHDGNGYGNTWNFEYLGTTVVPTEPWSFYGWGFNTCDRCESPRVRIQSCDPVNGFSPSPAPGNQFVPLASDIYVEFEYQNSDDALMNTSSYENNFTVYECSDGENPSALADCTEVTVNNFEAGDTYLEISGLNFSAGYWYVIELSSDILDAEQSNLNEYLWYFRIDPHGAVCEPDTLSIEPNNFVKEYIASDAISYIGLLVDSQNCYVCSSVGYDYEWESSDSNLATIPVINTSPTNVVLNDTHNIGSLKIKATSTLGSLELYDDTNLYITANCSLYDGNEDECLDETDSYHSNFDCCWDDYNNGCENTGSQICNNPFVRNRNCEAVGFGYTPSLASPSPAENSEIVVTDAHIYAEFAKSNVSVIMDETTFTGGITILNCGTGALPDTTCSSSNIPGITSIDSGANFVNYSHSGFAENTWYRMSLENSITDTYENSIIPRTWEFKTGTGICKTENILLQPSSASIQINSSMDYGVLCYDSSCNVCDDVYTYDWGTDDPGVAVVDELSNLNVNVAQAIGLGDTLVRVENNELSLDASSQLEVISNTAGPNCSQYQDEATCHVSGLCCWDGSICDEDMTACDEDCLVYSDEATCVAEACCWASGDCYFENNPICDIPGPIVDMEVLSNYPENNFVDVCLNSLIQATFDMPINSDSLDGNVTLSSGSLATSTTYSVHRNSNGGGILNIYTQYLLEENTIYEVVLTGDSGGIESIYGNELNCPVTGFCTWSFTTADSVCNLSYVKIFDPADDYYEFNDPNFVKEFIAEGRSISGEAIVPIPDIYDWKWRWESLDESLVTLIDNNLNSAEVTSENNNGTTKVKVTASQVPEEDERNTYDETSCNPSGCCWDDGVCTANLDACGINKVGYKGVDLSDEVEVELFMCENPWEFEDSDYNFKLKYCMDGGLPYLDNNPIVRTSSSFNSEEISSGLLKEYIFKYIDPLARNNSNTINLVDVRSEKSILSEIGISELTDNRLSFKLLARMFSNFISEFFNEKVLAQTATEIPTDIIGLRIYKNERHLSPLDWYRSSSAVTFQGSPSPIVINDYSGLRDGRTVYVNAASTYIGGFNSINTNIYTNVSLLSYNQNAGLETTNIFNQLVNDWTFNINLDPDLRDDVIEDVIRWQDLRTMETKLDNYAFQNKYCAYVIDPVRGVCSTFPINYYHFDIDGDNVIDSFNEITEESSECYNVSTTVSCNSDSECQNHEMGFDKCVGVYPEINEGTYVQGISTSAWPSWTATLSNEIGSSLPVDPINEFSECADPNNPLVFYNEQTCWSVSNETFFCPIGSQVYYYQTGNSYNVNERALSFNLYSLFNFNDSNRYSWSGLPESGVYNSAFNFFNSINISNNSVCNGQISAICGDNNVVLGIEECEAGSSNPIYRTITYCEGSHNEIEMGCGYDCQWPLQPEVCQYCGDGIINGSEQCDGEIFTFCENDYNPQSVGCNSNCDGWTPELEACRYCGDGICLSEGIYIEDSITCYDDCGDCGNGICEEDFENVYSCPGDCGGFCGDGIVSVGEICDPEISIGDECFTSNSYSSHGNSYPGHFQCLNNCSGWNTQCVSDGICGDGVIDGNEVCEPGDIGPQCGSNGYYGNLICNPVSDPNKCFWGACNITEYCGDGSINGPEQCDDGNLISGDGCSGNESGGGCTTEECGNGITDVGEECDDWSNGDNTDQCYDNCTFTRCNDNILQQPNGYQVNEVCDTDTPQSCTMPDGYGGEQTCSNNCLAWDSCAATEWCDDGILNGLEECDPSDPNPNWDTSLGEACNASCDIVINLNILQIKPSSSAVAINSQILDPHRGDSEFIDNMATVNAIEILISDFNSDPENYLPSANRLEDYNVLVFGWQDCNASQDLDSSSAQAVADFIDAGGAVIFGHDTFWNDEDGNTCAGVHQYFNSLMNYAGIRGIADWNGFNACAPSTDGGIPYSGNTINGNEAPVSAQYDQVQDNNFLAGELMYTIPYDLSNASPMSVLNTHSSCQVLDSDYCEADDGLKIWFYDNDGAGISWANTCGKVEMIQLGHITGFPEPEERKALINMLYYIATKGDELLLNRTNLKIPIIIQSFILN